MAALTKKQSATVFARLDISIGLIVISGCWRYALR
jgi:hypothetical protein